MLQHPYLPWLSRQRWQPRPGTEHPLVLGLTQNHLLLVLPGKWARATHPNNDYVVSKVHSSLTFNDQKLETQISINRIMFQLWCMNSMNYYSATKGKTNNIGCQGWPDYCKKQNPVFNRQRYVATANGSWKMKGWFRWKMTIVLLNVH